MTDQGAKTGAARPSRRTNKERSETTRTRLLEAAVQCLYEYGYAGTTTVRVAGLSGYTRGAGLHHFPTKVDLILATALHIIEEQNKFRAARRSDTTDPVESFLETVTVVWDSWARPHAIAQLEIQMGARSDPELAARYPAIRRQIEAQQRGRFWERAQAAGIRDKEAVEDLLVFSVATMRGLTIERLIAAEQSRIDRAFELMKKARLAEIRRLIEDGKNNDRS